LYKRLFEEVNLPLLKLRQQKMESWSDKFFMAIVTGSPKTVFALINPDNFKFIRTSFRNPLSLSVLISLMYFYRGFLLIMEVPTRLNFSLLEWMDQIQILENNSMPKYENVGLFNFCRFPKRYSES